MFSPSLHEKIDCHYGDAQKIGFESDTNPKPFRGDPEHSQFEPSFHESLESGDRFLFQRVLLFFGEYRDGCGCLLRHGDWLGRFWRNL